MLELSFTPGLDPRIERQMQRDAARLGALAIERDTGTIHVLRHRDVRRLLVDPRLRGLGMSLFDLVGLNDGPLREWYASLMFSNEGPPHHRMRRLVSKAFTPKAVQDLRPVARALVAERLAQVQAAGDGDLVALMSDVPSRLMCRLLGVPDEDLVRFIDWVAALSPVFRIMTPAEQQAGAEAIVKLLEYVHDLRDRRIAKPGDDLISALIAAEHEGDRLTGDEMVQMVANLLVAGHDTTGAQIGCTLLTLLQRPDVLAEVAADESLIAAVVDETIRFEPSLHIAPRTTIADVEIDGEVIPSGSLLYLNTMTANRDPEVWIDADRFNSHRFRDPDVPKMMTFGGGMHFCLGTWLARVTLEEVVRGVALSGPRLRVHPDSIAWVVPLGAQPAELPVAA